MSGCDLAAETRLKFLRSGIEIQPYEVQTRTESERFSHMVAVVSRAAGKLVADEMHNNEPVLLTIGGQTQGRYMIDRDAVQLSTEDASITLYDAWKVFYGGSVNGTWRENDLHDVISDIIFARSDPGGVITGIKEADEGAAEVRASFGSVPPLVEAGLETMIAGLSGLNVVNTSVSFNGVTPAEALFELEQRFSIHTWVDKGGVFHYTNPASIQYAQLGIQPGGTNLRLTDWNVTVGSGHVSQVTYRSPLQYVQVGTTTGRFEKTQPKDVYIQGTATLNDVPGVPIVEDAPVGVNTPEAVENAAYRRLVLEYMNRRAGNIVFNGLESTDAAGLVAVSPGDMIGSQGGTVGRCRRQIEAGTFIVRSVNHTISAREGWLVTVDVAAIPSASITTSAFIYNPETGETWEDLTDYAESDVPVSTPFHDFIR